MGAFEKVIPGQQVAVRCPQCGHQRTQSLAWIRSNKRMTCNSCGTKFETSQFDSAARSGKGGVNDSGKRLSKTTSLRTKGG